MEVNPLLASVAINILLAFVILSLFSIFRKMPSKAHIYLARHIPIHDDDDDDPVCHSHSLLRFVPSFGWISVSRHISEDQLLQEWGLDRLVLIKLIKFGIKFFLVCSVVGLLLLLPLNYFAGVKGGRSSSSSHSMDSFTISNIRSGSDWLWVHCSCLYFVSFYGLFLLYKEYEDILQKRILQLHNMRHQPNQFTVLVREIPLCDEHNAHDCSVDHFFSKYHPHSYQSYQILHDGKDQENLLSKSKSISQKIEKLRHHSQIRKHRRSFSLSEARKSDAKIEELRETLQELSCKIRHSQSKELLQAKELPVAFVTFRSRWGASLAAQSQQISNPLMWITEMAPEPRDVLWRNLGSRYKYTPLHKLGVYIASSLLTIFFAVPVTAVQGIAKFDRLKKWFPPAMAVQIIPGLRSVVTGYLPSAVLNGFIYVVPFAMIEMSKLAGYPSRSRKDIKACNLVFYFLVGNVFFLSLLSGSLLDEIGESFSHPKNFPAHLASAASAQADFFMTYILTNGLTGFSLEILQPGLLIWDAIKSHAWDCGASTRKEAYLYSLPYYRIIPFVALCVLIGMVYAVVSPLLLPLLVAYFCLGYVVMINQIQDVYTTTYETCGQYWPYIHHYILVSIIIMQVTMIGLFGLKSKPAASFCTIPLLVFTLLFNEYCKIRFLPTFNQCSVKDARDRDEYDEMTDVMEANRQNAIDAYSPPCLKPADLEDVESASSSQPLISSK